MSSFSPWRYIWKQLFSEITFNTPMIFIAVKEDRCLIGWWYCTVTFVRVKKRDTVPRVVLRTFNGCEVRIDTSITRVTVRHHEACRVMANSYPEWQNFQFIPTIISFSYILFLLSSTIVFKPKRLYLSLNMRYFNNFALKWVHYRSRNVRFGSDLRYPDAMHEVVLHPFV